MQVILNQNKVNQNKVMMKRPVVIPVTPQIPMMMKMST